MSDSDRTYRGGKSYAVPVWNGILEHRDKIGPAIWTFLWLLDKITAEKDGVGTVLGGRPVTVAQIAADLKENEKTIRRQLKTLHEGHYIDRKLKAYGFVITVLKSRKFNAFRSDINARPDAPGGRTKMGDRSDTDVREGRTLSPDRSDINARPNKETQQDTTGTQQYGGDLPPMTQAEAQLWTENNYAWKDFCREMQKAAHANVGANGGVSRSMVLNIARATGVPDRVAIALECD